jgi:hypothetical protein
MFGSKHTMHELQQQVTKNKVTATRIWPYIAQHFTCLLQTPYLSLHERDCRFREINQFLEKSGQFRR